MNRTLRNRLLSTVSTVLLISAYPGAINAGCKPGADEAENDIAPNGIGAPSVTASEISTGQVLQFLRRRQDEIQLASNSATLVALPATQTSLQGTQVVTQPTPPTPNVVAAQAAAKKAEAAAKRSEAAAVRMEAAAKRSEAAAAAKQVAAGKPGDPQTSAAGQGAAGAAAAQPGDNVAQLPSAPGAAPQTAPAAEAGSDAGKVVQGPAVGPAVTAKVAPKRTVARSSSPTVAQDTGLRAGVDDGVSLPPQKPVYAARSAPAGDAAYQAELSSSSFDGGAPAISGKFAFWGGAFGDVERRHNLPLSGSLTPIKSTQTTSGLVAGTDWAVPQDAGAPGTVRLGLFGGLTESKTKYSDGLYNDSRFGSANADCEQSNDRDVHCFFRYGAQSEARGASVGTYGLYVAGPYSFDLVGKADINKTRARDFNRECAPDDHPDIYRESRQSSVAFTLAGNGSYRVPISGTAWLEPTVGFRYLHLMVGAITSPFGDGTATEALVGPLPIGLTDGDALRVQAGMRIGITERTPIGQWTGVLGGFAYSEVMVSGFTAAANPSVLKIDENKLRGLLQLTNTLTTANGYSYQLQGDVRGGDNLLGYGGKFVIRKEW